MVVVNNTAPASSDSGNGLGFLMGVVLLIIFVVLLVYYGIPAIRGAAGSSSPQINVPGKVDVNVHQNGY